MSKEAEKSESAVEDRKCSCDAGFKNRQIRWSHWEAYWNSYKAAA
jgi:hypothetical protein